jgi:hypothetical protein
MPGNSRLQNKDIVMTNVALSKKVLESSIKHPEVVTDGDIVSYTHYKGYAAFTYPGTLTIDLEEVHEIKCIRILIWDGLGEGGTQVDARRYRYRLAVSKDNNNWEELYTTAPSPEAGTIGWQIFNFKTAIRVRYIRIYGLHNTDNEYFHIVEVEAHDDSPPKPGGYIGTDIELSGEQKESISREETPQAVTKIDSKELNRIIETLEKSPIDKTLVRDIKARFEDLIILDQNLEAIRREIVNPVTDEMKKSNQLAIFALILTIIGLILTIITTIFSIATK